ncbi:alpha/beta hydrolase [Facklamia miroungae]|uniref:alpha/beta hydrolase n=1 Tax=Facklamia miroungae TaxID=120956 RepID=UPI001FDF617E|nr:alpha/beta hydrolase [Facklamia miroungae]
MKIVINVPFDKAVYLEGDDKRVGVLLFHAYTGSTRDMNLLARLLNRQGYTVLVPQFSGHDTQNIKTVLEYSPNIWRQEAHEAYHWMLLQDYDHLLVFGLSMGGVMATDIISQKDFKGSGGGIFNAPVVTEEPIDISNSFMHLGKFLASQRHDTETFMEEFDDILEEHWQQMKELEIIKREIASKLTNIHVPFYIAQSGEDELIDPEDSYLLQDYLVNARIDFHYFPHNTHSIPTNRDRKEFDRSVLDFVKQVTQPL